MNQIAASATMVIAQEPNQPTWSDSRYGSSAGRSLQSPNCQAARVEPTMNPKSVSTIELCPEPTANRVPDAQAPPSCMPIANRNEPTMRPIPIGPALGAGTEPNSPLPVPMISAKSVAVVPSSRACARSPVPLPTATSCRQAEVNPNREWNRANPSPSPSSSRTPGLAPCATNT